MLKPTSTQQTAPAARVSSRRLHRISIKAGFTVPELHDIWQKGKSGDQSADRKLRSLLESRPAVWEVIDSFIAGARSKGRSRMDFALTKAIVFKKPDSIWATAKAKWISVESAGLPTLGKRR